VAAKEDIMLSSHRQKRVQHFNALTLALAKEKEVMDWILLKTSWIAQTMR
jgi:hypothetical protein